MIIHVTVQPSWLGWVLVAATSRGICAVKLGDSAESLTAQLQQQFPQAEIQASSPAVATWVEQVIARIDRPIDWPSDRHPVEHPVEQPLPLDIAGTAFQQRVWQALQAIPLGSTASYGTIAQRLGNPKAVRAVARACAANPVAVLIPCHRVVGHDGALRGYRWGCDRKRALLYREAAQATPALGVSALP